MIEKKKHKEVHFNVSERADQIYRAEICIIQVLVLRSIH